MKKEAPAKNGSEAPKKKRIRFQFGIRKRMRTDMIVVGSIVAFSLLMSPLIGMMNAMASSMGVIVVFISTWYDFTLEPVKNGAILTAGVMGMPAAAFLGYCFFPPGTAGYTVMMTVVTFLTFLSVITFFTSEENGNFYMPLLLNFSTMLYAPVYHWDLLVRFGLSFLSLLAVLFFQLVLHRSRFRRKVREDLDAVLDKSETQMTAIMTREPKEALLARSGEIDSDLTAITRTIGPKLAQLTRWQANHNIMWTVQVLRRINNTITARFIRGEEQMSRELYQSLEALFDAIDRFENDQIPESDMVLECDRFFAQVDASAGEASAAALRLEMEDFVSEKLRHETVEESRTTLRERVEDKINLYTLIFALKTSVVAALGVCVTCLFQIDNASMYIMTIAVLAQPYVEVGSKKIKLRILNTLFALAIFLIAFSIPGSLWIHMLILMGLILIGDMFFQFETNVIGSTMIAVVSRVASDPTQMLSMTFYRLSYVAAAGLILLLVDVLIFPNRLTASLKKQLRRSAEANQKLREVLFSPDCTAEQVRTAILEKRRVNQRVKHVNQFVQHPEVTASLLADEAWISRLMLIAHRMQLTGTSPEELRRLIEAEESKAPSVPDLRQKSLLYSLNEVFDEMFRSEEIAAGVTFG